MVAPLKQIEFHPAAAPEELVHDLFRDPAQWLKLVMNVVIDYESQSQPPAYEEE